MKESDITVYCDYQYRGFPRESVVLRKLYLGSLIGVFTDHGELISVIKEHDQSHSFLSKISTIIRQIQNGKCL